MTKTQIVKKGKHYTKFHQKYWGVYKVREREKFTIVLSGPGLRYDHDGPDQWDWNKMPNSAYFDCFRPHGQSVLIGWRYNPEVDKVEVCHYYHGILDPENKYTKVGRVPGLITPGYHLSLPIDRYGKATLNVTREIVKDTGHVTTSMWSPWVKMMLSDTVQFLHIGKYYTKGNLYFGGNLVTEDYVKGEILS